MLDLLKFVSILFLIFEKGDQSKIVLGFLRFASIHFNIVSEKIVSGFLNILF